MRHSDPTWLLDSRTSIHLPSDRNSFIECKECAGWKVNLVNGEPLPVRGHDKVYIKRNAEEGWTDLLEERVEFVPELDKLTKYFCFNKKSICSVY